MENRSLSRAGIASTLTLVEFFRTKNVHAVMRKLGLIFVTMSMVFGCSPSATHPTAPVEAMGPRAAAWPKPLEESKAGTQVCGAVVRRDGVLSQIDDYVITFDLAGRIAKLRKTTAVDTPRVDENAPRDLTLTIARSYDAAGHVVEEIRRDTEEGAQEVILVDERKVTWSRDAAGRIDHAELTWSLFTHAALTRREIVTATIANRDVSGRPSRLDFITTKTEFANGQRQKEWVEQWFREREYDDSGRVTTVHWPDEIGVGGSKRSITVKYSYEGRQVTEDLVVQEGSRQTEQRIVTTYDESGRRIRSEEFFLIIPPRPYGKPYYVEQLEYDDAGRLAAKTVGGQVRTTFEYRGDCPANILGLFEARVMDNEPPLWGWPARLAPSLSPD